MKQLRAGAPDCEIYEWNCYYLVYWGISSDTEQIEYTENGSNEVDKAFLINDMII